MDGNTLYGTVYVGDFTEDGYVQAFAPATSGDLVITNHGDGTYDISFSFLDDNGNTWDGQWSGPISISTQSYSNSQRYIYTRISRLQRRARWTMWQYYTLGKLTHYLADAFTYPHNENYPDSMLCHHQYETDLRAYLEEYLSQRAVRREKFRQDVVGALQELHRQYMAGVADMRKDVQFILKATSMLMAGCLPEIPSAALAGQSAQAA